MTRHLLVVGASGVIGAAAVERFCRTPGWRVTGLSRRPPVVDVDCQFDHVPVDLGDRAACAVAVAAMPTVTDMVYAAVREAPGLVAGWRDDALIAQNGRMFANILDPVVNTGRLRHLQLLQGAKAYGGHRHPVTTPAREDRPRDDHPNFYWLQEDHARDAAARAGFALTIWRPQVLIGGAPGAAMNPVAAIGAYAALCRELDRPFACPGVAPVLWELVDADLLAEGLIWAADSPAARGGTFNITNGDGFVLAHAWPDLAARLGLGDGGHAPQRLADFFAAPEARAAWRDLARRHDLRATELPALLGESHHYLDLLLSARIAEKGVPLLLSTIKVRRAGFGACRDSLDSLVAWLQRMVALHLLPPFATSAGAAG